jgi:Uma2 family endonuclease
MSHAPERLHAPKGVIRGEPTWDVTQLFPTQGNWSESDYMELNTNHLVEFSHGFLEFLPMPTMNHQLIAMSLCRLLHSFVSTNNLGTVLIAAFMVRLWEGKFREPDVLFMKREHASRMNQQYWEGADLVMEVVSPDDPSRDLETKREEYALAGISEYWIIEPDLGKITVLTLSGVTYAVHGEFYRGDQATSKLLPGFVVDVTAALSVKM